MDRCIFKPRRRVNGKLVESRNYSVRLRMDWEPKPAKIIALKVSDRSVANLLVDELVRERHLERQGLLPPRSIRNAESRPLLDLLEEFLRDLRARGRSATTCSKYRSNIGLVFAGCGWTHLKDVTPQSFCRWRARGSLAPKTANDRLSAARTVFRWLVQQKMAKADPLDGVDKVSNRGRPRFRRALSEDELRRLIERSPRFRGIVYLFMAETGLRRLEVNQLRVGDFFLDAPAPFVRARSATTKNRREAVLRLRPHIVASIRSIIPDGAASTDWVFHSRVPRMTTLRRDLARAEIPFETEEGRVDLHALRVTFGTNLAKAGVHPRATQELMRHSDINLTMRIYTDVSQLGVASAVDKLPAFEVGEFGQLRSVTKAAAENATGKTDDTGITQITGNHGT